MFGICTDWRVGRGYDAMEKPRSSADKGIIRPIYCSIR